jgi:hypothetical protein
METPPPIPSAPENFEEGNAVFIGQTCIPFLRNAQNLDGGWGFLAGSDSRVEATSWALLALREFSSATETKRIDLGLHFLHSTQLPDGSWPSAPGQQQGSWVTALACWCLESTIESQHALARGLTWLSHQRPGDSRLWRRLLRRFMADKGAVGQNDAYYGWCWTPGTASWVEPTSYALLVLRHGEAIGSPTALKDRFRLAESMLFDRMCPGGGWNCGNPMVYGVPGQAQIGPTAWALLALREIRGREEIQKSLEWLENNWQAVLSPGSLALAQICLNSYGRPIERMRAVLCGVYSTDNILWSVPAVAWSVLAMSPAQSWLRAPRLVHNT